jgi:hypothetical protein
VEGRDLGSIQQVPYAGEFCPSTLPATHTSWTTLLVAPKGKKCEVPVQAELVKGRGLLAGIIQRGRLELVDLT